MINKKENKSVIKLGKTFLIILFLCFSLFIGFQIQNNEVTAIGGGFVGNPGRLIVSANATFTTGLSSSVPANIQGIYIVVGVTTFDPSISVSTIKDGQGNTYHLAIKSTRYQDTEIWYANYTGTNFGTNVLNITFSGSTKAIIRYLQLSGVISGSLQVGSGNGTGTNMNVTSFTPNLNSACFTISGLSSGSTTPTTFGTPNFWYNQDNSRLSTLAFDYISLDNNGWFSYGATTIGESITPTVSPVWDIVYSCFPQGLSTTTTILTTATGTIFPEPANSTDLILFIFAFVIILIFMLGAWLMRDSSFGALLSMISGIISVYEFFGLNSAPTIVYNSTSFTVPSYFPQIMIIFAVVSFVLSLYFVFRSRGRW